MVRCFLYVRKSQQTKGEQRKRKRYSHLALPGGLLAAAGLWQMRKKAGAGGMPRNSAGSALLWWAGFDPHRQIHDICLAVCGEHVWLKGLVDTGNCLYDGGERYPVCVLDKVVMKRQLPTLYKKLHMYLREGINDEALGLHYLAFCSLGRPDGVALAFTAEYLLVQKNRSKRKTIHPHIAVADSGLLFGRGYQIILNPDVLRKREE